MFNLNGLCINCNLKNICILYNTILELSLKNNLQYAAVNINIENCMFNNTNSTNIVQETKPKEVLSYDEISRRIRELSSSKENNEKFECEICHNKVDEIFTCDICEAKCCDACSSKDIGTNKVYCDNCYENYTP